LQLYINKKINSNQNLKVVMDVSIEDMIKDAKEINPNLKIFITSAITGENISKLINCILN